MSVREVTPLFLDSVAVLTPTVTGDAYGRAALTFTTQSADGHDLWLCVSSDSGVTFTRPTRVNEREGSVVVADGDRPTAVFGPRGAFAIAWTERRAGDARATDVRVRPSGDGGSTLAPAAFINEDRPDAPAWQPNLRFWRWRRAITATHSHAALAFRSGGELVATWIDEREFAMADQPPQTAGLYAAMSPDGGTSWSVNQKLRDSVSMCARPAILGDGEGHVSIAYRRTEQQERDPALLIWPVHGPFAFRDTLLAREGWRATPCPPATPALSSAGSARWAAWYTGAAGGGIHIAPWSDRGATGVSRAADKGLTAASRPQLVPFAGSTLIAALGRPDTSSRRVVLAVRAIAPDGSLGDWQRLGADVEDGWIAGLTAKTALACWIERSPRRLRIARLSRSQG